CLLPDPQRENPKRKASGGGMATGREAGEPAMAEEERDWADLTPVCLAEAFSRLGPEDLWRGAMACCRAWREAARSRPALFAALDLEPAFDAVGADAAEWWTPAFQRRVDAMLRSAASLAAGELREVRVRHCSDDALAFAAKSSPQLSILSIQSSPSVTDRSMLTVASCCPILTELDISYCYEVSYKSLEFQQSI
uniref:F-box domain-containing protein n=1 Tax=Aegilops tauschii subsp. strangulata TaxID=200361 RepID=A0A452XS34_AEGTS